MMSMDGLFFPSPARASARLSLKPTVAVDRHRTTMVARVAGALFSILYRGAGAASRAASVLGWSLQGGHWPCGHDSAGEDQRQYIVS
jgi:hypothetical protein